MMMSYTAYSDEQDGAKWSDSEHIMKVEPVGLADDLCMTPYTRGINGVMEKSHKLCLVLGQSYVVNGNFVK